MPDPSRAVDGLPDMPAADPTGHQPPSSPGATTTPGGAPASATNVGTDRGEIIASGLRQGAMWGLRFVILVVALGLFFWLVGQVWAGLLPVLIAILVSTVLWPEVRFLTSRGWPPALAAATSVILALVVVSGLVALIAPSIGEQSMEVAQKAGAGIETVQDWLAGPPFNVDSIQLEDFTGRAGEWLQSQAGGIAAGVFTGVAVVGSVLVTTVLAIVLTFFFLKDGPAFLPWARRLSGHRAGLHLTEVLARVYRTLSGFIRTQALVGLIDAVFIGLGLLLLGVPLAFALAVLTFFAAFIPVVGAVVAGAFAVLVALVSNGPTTALFVLLIVLAVQQLEGNVLLPMLQGRSMDLHAGVVLIAITIGSTLFGVVGAFLAVPVAASVIVVLRYISEQIDLRTGDLTAADLAVATPEGKVIAARVERASSLRRLRTRDAARAATPAENDQRPASTLVHRLARALLAGRGPGGTPWGHRSRRPVPSVELRARTFQITWSRPSRRP